MLVDVCVVLRYCVLYVIRLLSLFVVVCCLSRALCCVLCVVCCVLSVDMIVID